MNIPPLFSFMFFLMLILLALGCICGDFECVLSVFFDEFPKMRKHQMMVTIAVCTTMFVFGLTMCFDSGFLLFHLMDTHAINSVLHVALLELICVAWIYGSQNFLVHITQEMGINIPKYVRVYWLICWSFITPIFIFISTVLTWTDYEDVKLLSYTYPDFIQVIGWLIEFSPVLVIIMFSSFTVIKRYRNGESIKYFLTQETCPYLKPGPMLTPKTNWGPKHDTEMVEPKVATLSMSSSNYKKTTL